MPELPEVETVRRQLSQMNVGEEVEGVVVREKRSWRGGEIDLTGEKIVRVEREGKYLLIYFESGRGLVIHLRMTGRVIVSDQLSVISVQDFDYETAKHTRVVIRLKSGKSLYYWSTRMFGYIQVESQMEQAVNVVKSKLGPDPWKMSEKEWGMRLGKTRRKIKDAILDQKLVAGVGNIYANDALHLAKIRPQKIASELRKKEREKLLKTIRQVMERGLELNGASDNSYVDARGEKGEYQNEFLVYGKTKDECPSCNKKLEYGKVGGRGTWWCEECQS